MYSKPLWDSWVEQELENYKIVRDKDGKKKRKYLKKGYQHLDPRVWLPQEKGKIEQLLKDGLKVRNKKTGQMAWHAFAPFLKTLIKTPRYKFQDDIGEYDLETKIRPISYASHVDSLILGYYSYALTKQYEAYIDKQGFSDCVLAYRSNLGGKCNIQFAKEVFDEVRNRGNCTAIALDIKGYFDHIDHKILLEKWQKIIGDRLPEDQFKIYKTLTQYSYINRSSFLKKYSINLRKVTLAINSLLDFVPDAKTYEKYDTIRKDQLIVKNERHIGIPQGSAISALLSNVYLIDFDKMMHEKAQKEGFMYRRYCDDILIVCDTENAEMLKKFAIEQIMNGYRLTIQDKKVEITDFTINSAGRIRAFNKKKLIADRQPTISLSNEEKYYNELQYLGFQFNGQRVNVRPSSLSRYFRKMSSRIVKTVSMAYSGKVESNKIWKEQLLHRYSHLGKRNFLTYVYNSSQREYENSKGEIREGFNDPAIRRQVKRHMDVLREKLEVKNHQRFLWKAGKQKVISKKQV